jgi:transcriptional regulator with GAF, ATPase, and Fis domain
MGRGIAGTCEGMKGARMSDNTGSIDLARGLAETSIALLGQGSMERTLEAVARHAPVTVPAADSACVGVFTHGGTVRFPAHGDRPGTGSPELRGVLEAGDGPVRAAASDGSLLRIDDTAAEERWPEFARRAAGLGVRSLVACGLRAGSGLRAALILQSAKPGAFDDRSIDAADVYVTHASAAVSLSRTTESLRHAMRTRQVIGEATGILMERRRIGSAAAFEELVRASQNLNVKLRVVAEHVVRTGQDPQTLRRSDFPPGG